MSHLQFADDTIIFYDTSQQYIRMLQCVLKCFEAVSGLRLNLAKSSLIAVGGVPNLDQLAHDLGCRRGSLSSTYLGYCLVLHSSGKMFEVSLLIGCGSV